MELQTQRSNGDQRRRDSRNDNAEGLTNALGWFSIGLGLAELAAPQALAQLIGVKDDDRTRNVLRGYGLREIAAGIGILSRPQPAGWLWGRVAGDLMDLSSLGTALGSDSSNRFRVGAATAAVIGVTALDVRCALQLQRGSADGTAAKTGAVHVTRTIILNRSPEEVYRFWHDFTNLPTFMKHLESVQLTGDNRSHWKATGPGGKTVEWDAEMIDDQPNTRIAWRSLEGSDVHNSGSVQFERAPGGRGTLVRVEFQYTPPGGMIGATIAKLFGEEPGQQVDHDLRAFKQVLETGEVVKSDASIHRGMHPGQPSSREESLAAAAG
ncbi:MAG: SRPBCC family protein [Bryobacteraceae bacterium]